MRVMRAWGVRVTWIGVWLSLALLVVGCTGSPRGEPTGMPEPTLRIFVPPTDRPPPSPARSAVSLTEAVCTHDARFVEDLTVPDGTRVEPGEVLDKRWSVINTGSCDWGPGYRLVRLSGDAFGGPDEIALYPARAGTNAVWQVILEAPTASGEFRSRWQARAPDGSLFGEDVFLDVVVSP